jgi:hypothetical protein
MTALAGECQQVFMAAIFAFHAGKTIVQIAAIQITVNNLLDVRPPETILPREMFITRYWKTT